MENRSLDSVKPSMPLGYQAGRIVQNTERGPMRVGFDSDYDKGQMRITLVTLWNERIDIIAWMKEAIEKEDVNILREYLKERYAPSFVEGCKKLVLSGSFSPDQEIP